MDKLWPAPRPLSTCGRKAALQLTAQWDDGGRSDTALNSKQSTVMQSIRSFERASSNSKIASANSGKSLFPSGVGKGRSSLGLMTVNDPYCFDVLDDEESSPSSRITADRAADVSGHLSFIMMCRSRSKTRSYSGGTVLASISLAETPRLAPSIWSRILGAIVCCTDFSHDFSDSPSFFVDFFLNNSIWIHLTLSGILDNDIAVPPSSTSKIGWPLVFISSKWNRVSAT